MHNTESSYHLYKQSHINYNPPYNTYLEGFARYRR